MTAVFGWMVLLATPAQALAHSAPASQHREGVRALSAGEMRQMVGAQLGGGGGLHPTSVSLAAGSTYAWEGNAGDVNTGNGNKLTSVPLVGWTQRGGLPIAFTLYHNSEGNHNGELGQKWTHSYDLYLAAGGGFGLSSNISVHWGNDLSYTFTYAGGAYTAPTGIYDTLVQNVDGSYTLTTKAQVKYHFNTSLYCDTITDSNGNQTSISHNTGGYVTSVADATGRTLTLSYDTSNRISTVTDPLSRVWTLSYDTSNNLSQVALPLLAGQTVGSNYHYSFGYNAAHDLTTFTTPGGRGWTATYNSADNSLATETDGCGNQTSYAYTASSTTITDANSHVVTHNYSGGTLSNETDNLSHSVAYTYDASYNKTAVQDQRGKTWNYTFDSNGNTLTKTDPLTNVTTYTYNSHNKVLTVTDALSHVTTTNTYDGCDNLLTSTDALSHQTSYGYDSNGYGLLVTITDPLTHVTSMGYDTDGNLTSVEDANSHTATISVNGLGWKTGTTDALSHSSTISYDTWGRTTSVTTPAGTTSNVYDADSNVTSVTDGNSHTSSTTYDNDSRPLIVTSANGDTFTYVYDGTGQKGLLSSTTDGNSHSTTFSYNSLNCKTGASYADSTSESWAYDNAGNLSSHVDGNGRTISNTYDDAGQLTTVTYPTGSGAGTGISYTYDVAGRRTGMTDVTGSWGYTFDNANRLTQISAPNGNTGYGYDNANRRTSMTVSGVTGSWSYSYDAGNRLTSTSNPYSESTSLGYDDANRLTTQTNGNSSVSTFGYDAANRTTDVWHRDSSANVLAHYDYTYDYTNNVSTRTDTNGDVTSFGYDASDQLTGESRGNGHGLGYALAFTYDHNHNRATKVVGTGMSAVTDTYSYDAHDKLTGISGGTNKTYGYDSNGNCTSVTVGTNVTTVAYDVENRVTSITYPSSAVNTFAYNGEDLRTQKVDSSGTKNYVCDGSSPASAVLKDGAAVYTPGLSERRSGTSKFLHVDALGSTRGITDSSQSVTDSLLYDAFGNVLSRTGTTPTPFGFVGSKQYQTDSDSGLQLLGHRYYDPSIGRFLSSDPAQAGTNWYAYCNNNPLGKIDPMGLYWIFDRSTGEIIWVPEAPPKGHNKNEFGPWPPEVVGGGYSGQPGHQDPSQDGEHDLGPIPKGNYKIGRKRSNKKRHNYFPLTPVAGTDMHGRDGMLIHGDNPAHPGESSTGCIVTSGDVRDVISSRLNEPGGSDLIVK